VTSVVERLGYPPHTRLLIVNCDDLGSCHAANVGVYEALRDGVATSASLMVPCPWARDAAARYRGEDIGVHLTLNAEHDLFRWGPITQAPSLLDGDGGFPRTLQDLWDHADLDEVRRECRAQVERAIYWGFDVSHLDSHMGTLELRPEFFDIYLELAVDFDLPMRLGPASSERAVGFPFRALAEERASSPPTTWCGPRASAADEPSSGPSPSWSPGSPSCASTRPPTRPSCGPSTPTGPDGSTTTTSSPATPAWAHWPSGPARSSSATGPCATSSAGPDRSLRPCPAPPADSG
jgi:hypothetical protein